MKKLNFTLVFLLRERMEMMKQKRIWILLIIIILMANLKRRIKTISVRKKKIMMKH
jgi:hypothetical protein